MPVYRSIRAALTLGGDDLAVDGVLLIGEHGDYPRTVLGQEMLPRRWFFEQVCGVIAEQRRPLPVFVDKHLAYRWSDARWMYDTRARVGSAAMGRLFPPRALAQTRLRPPPWARRWTRRSAPASTCWSGTGSTRWRRFSARWSGAREARPACAP